MCGDNRNIRCRNRHQPYIDGWHTCDPHTNTRDMFRTLPIRLRILALPGIAAIGFVLALSVTLLFGQLAQSQLTQIERGYAPSLATSQALVDALGSLQRALRDAVAVSDTSAVSAADSIATRFETELAKFAGNPVVDPRDHQNIGDAFQAYYALTAKASTGMINGTLGDDATTPRRN